MNFQNRKSEKADVDGHTEHNYISPFVTQNGMNKTRLLSLDTLANVVLKATVIEKFRMSEYDIPSALEKTVMADLSALVTWSSKITLKTKTILFPLVQCLRPRDLVR